MKTISYLALSVLLLISCNDNHKANELLKENTDEEMVKNKSEVVAINNDPILDCSEFLSPIELIESWEMMKAETFDNRAICFGGYIFRKDINDSLSKAMVAFRPFKNENIIPMVECEFAGEYKTLLDKYMVGDKVKIVGKLVVVEDRTKHNFIFTNCSLK